MFDIYCYENKINGKVYIGYSSNIKKRYSQHKSGDGIRNHSAIDLAIKKYSIDNFNFWIFCVVSTKEEANQEEIYWIAEMRNQLGRDMVYNMTNGGEGAPGTPKSEDHKKKIGATNKIRSAGKKQSQTTIDKRKMKLIGKPRQDIRKFTFQIAEQIRYEYSNGCSLKILKEKYKTTNDTLLNIIRRITYQQ